MVTQMIGALRVTSFAPKAKSVIWLFMNGGVSRVESFDPKPMLNKYAGKTIAETLFADVQNPDRLAIERLVVLDGNGISVISYIHCKLDLGNTARTELRSAIGSPTLLETLISWRS